MTVRADLNISLDGFATTTDQIAEHPMGMDWQRLVAAYVGTRTFRARVLQDTTGQGTTGLDDDYAKAYFADVGAEIMGAGMFGLHNFPDDPHWQGWWGDDPPFRVPVFVLTHTPRPKIVLAGGTSFEFHSATPAKALERARAAADGKDVRIGGGVSVVRDFLQLRLIDQLHIGIAPILLGRGVSLWDDLRGLENDYTIFSEVAPSGTIHITLRRD